MSSQPRRELIASTGIEIIAQSGLRALTHRAVDRAAELPQGTTSYHAQTRDALLQLIVDELAGRAIADAEGAAASQAGVADQMDLDGLTALMTGLVHSLAQRRTDMRARYALILELDTAPALRDRLLRQSAVHAISRAITSSALVKAGLSATEEHIEALISLVDSLVFRRVALHDPAPPESTLGPFLRGIASATG